MQVSQKRAQNKTAMQVLISLKTAYIQKGTSTRAAVHTQMPTGLLTYIGPEETDHQCQIRRRGYGLTTISFTSGETPAKLTNWNVQL